MRLPEQTHGRGHTFSGVWLKIIQCRAAAPVGHRADFKKIPVFYKIIHLLKSLQKGDWEDLIPEILHSKAF